MSPNKFVSKGQQTMLVSMIGDEDTITGLLLTGVGERNVKGETNFLIVEQDTKPELIEKTFKKFISQSNIAVVLITQEVAEKYLRHHIMAYDQIIPTILEIPSKEFPYDPKKDTVIQKATRMLYGSDA